MKVHLVLLLCGVAHIRAEEEEAEELTVASTEVKYTPPSRPASAFLAETFDNGLGRRWVKSAAKKDGADEAIAKYNGEWEVKEADVPVVLGDVGLVLTTKARHAAITSKLDRPFTFTGKPLVVQYEVKYQNGMDCGGSYMKLLSEVPGLDPKQVTDKSGYTIMFGPDACGMDKKLHFIMRHRNPKTGEFEEKHAKKPTDAMDYYGDKKTHLFRLTVKPDSTWEVHVDDAMVNSGSLLEDMTPPVNPPKEINDPNDFKPATWDDREKIPDPEASKPIDWDEDAPEFIVDEEAVKPAGWLDDEEELVADPDAEMPVDWDEEMDGEWEAPKIDNPLCKEAPGCGPWTRPKKRNPAYKGKWKPEMIANPDYSGVWAPRKIANPDFFEDLEPYKMTPIGAVAFELWSMTDGVMFDNILVTDDLREADEWTAQTWHVKRDAELAESVRNAAPLLQPVWDALEDKPWLWAVLIISMLLPIGLIVYCCTGSKGDESVERKKTDAPSPDDPVADEGEGADEGAAGADEGAAGDSPPPARSASPSKRSSSPKKGDRKRNASPSKSGRAALSEPAAEEDEEGTADEGPSDQHEESVEENTAESQEEAEPATRKSPRKRKPRKE